MTGEGGIRTGNVGACFLKLSLSGNLCVCVCVCVCVFVCVVCGVHESASVALLDVLGGSKVGTVSCTFTSGCRWLRGLPARPPLRPLDSGGGVPDCDCVGERWSPPYQVCPCHLVAVGEAAPAREWRARGDGGAVRRPIRRGTGRGRSRGSGCRTEPPSSARTVAGRFESAPP